MVTNEQSMDLDVHPVVYFWKSKALFLQIASKYSMDKVIPKELNKYIENKWEANSEDYNGIYIIMKDIKHSFHLMNSLDGLILDRQTSRLSSVPILSHDKSVVTIVNFNGIIDDFKDYLSFQSSSFNFDWDLMVSEEKEISTYSISLKFQNADIAKAFVLDFNDTEFYGYRLQMFC